MIVVDAKPLPDSILNMLSKASIFTTMDLNKGFWQIRMYETSKMYNAFKYNLSNLEEILVWKVVWFSKHSCPNFWRL